jgi:hypothetical protein
VTDTATSSICRGVGSACVIALLAWGALAVLTQSASADPLLECSGATHETINPGLTNTQKEVEVTAEANYSSCTNVEDLGEGRTGTASDKITINTGCDDLLTLFTGTRTIKWSSGHTSVLDLTGSEFSDLLGEAVLTFAGTVTSGEFEGATVGGQDEFYDGDLDACTEPGGLKSITGLTELELTL